MEPSKGSEREIAELAGPRMPADQGLASLGLLMQFGGSVFLGVMALAATVPIFLAGAPGTFPIFLVAAAGAVRSVFHRMAGSALVHSSSAGPVRPVFVYVGVAVAQTVLTLLVVNHGGGVPASINFSIALLLLAWPLTLLVVFSSPRLRRLPAEGLPPAEDMGFEGVALLMIIGGAMGALMMGLYLYTVFRLPGELLSSPYALLMIGVLGMLLVRSLFHLSAGVRGARGVDSDGASNLASRYYSFGIISSVIAGGAMLLITIMGNLAGGPFVLLMVGVLVWLLLAWPLLLRRFYSERNYAALLAGDAGPNYRRAPDAGLTALGWLLLAWGVIHLAMSLPGALFGLDQDVSRMLTSLVDLGRNHDMDELGHAARSPWWLVGIYLTQIWAAVELIRMTDRYRLAATAYGAVASVVTVYVMWPDLRTVNQALDVVGGAGMGGIIGQFQIAMALVLPVSTILLANRNLVPTARARVRSPGPVA